MNIEQLIISIERINKVVDGFRDWHDKSFRVALNKLVEENKDDEGDAEVPKIMEDIDSLIAKLGEVRLYVEEERDKINK